VVTSAVEIFDLFMTLQDDYRLRNIYNTSGSSALNTYLEAWLLQAIVDFKPFCKNTLDYDKNTQTFLEELSLEEKIILSRLMIKYWLNKTIQDITQMNLAITDRDYKRYAESANLKEKMELYKIKVEELSQLINDYTLKNMDWENFNKP